MSSIERDHGKEDGGRRLPIVRFFGFENTLVPYRVGFDPFQFGRYLRMFDIPQSAIGESRVVIIGHATPEDFEIMQGSEYTEQSRNTRFNYIAQITGVPALLDELHARYPYNPLDPKDPNNNHHHVFARDRLASTLRGSVNKNVSRMEKFARDQKVPYDTWLNLFTINPHLNK